MGRLHPIAVLATVAILSVAAQAQRGMGGRGGGVSMGGRGGASMGARSGGGVSMGARAVGGRGLVAPARVGPAFSSGRGVAVRTPGRGVAVRSPGRAVVVHTGSRSGRVVVAGGNRFHHPFGFSGQCFNGFCRNPFFFHNRFLFNNPFLFGFGLGVPFYPYSYVPGFDNGYYGPQQQQQQEQPVAAADNGGSNDTQLAVEMQRMADEMESMREEQRQANLARTSGASLTAHQPAETTTFVFRDGHRISTPNYAIAGQTLWVLSEHAARKVSLVDLDVAATEQINAANGIDLHIPGSASR